MNALLTVEEVATILRCKRTKVFELLQNGTLARGERFGRQTVILADSVEAACRPAETTAPRKRHRTKKDLKAGLQAVLADVRAGRL